MISCPVFLVHNIVSQGFILGGPGRPVIPGSEFPTVLKSFSIALQKEEVC